MKPYDKTSSQRRFAASWNKKKVDSRSEEISVSVDAMSRKKKKEKKMAKEIIQLI